MRKQAPQATVHKPSLLPGEHCEVCNPPTTLRFQAAVQHDNYLGHDYVDDCLCLRCTRVRVPDPGGIR